jgi:4-diphosphocytidyl-2-C-methyl-D-erythritol kinase
MNYIHTIAAPAKINIGLHILSKRKDNYHNIETIFYPVKLTDKITVKVSHSKSAYTKIFFKSNSKDRELNDNNLCVAAVKNFLQDFNIHGSYEININLTKRIPVGAGLGGGSSDAAAVLNILASIFKLKENEKKELVHTALKTGSDVPYFLFGSAAYATSRGEKLTQLPDFKINYDILIVNPGTHVSTAYAYRKLNLRKEKPKTLNRIKFYSEKYNEKLSNDFEKVVFDEYPEIKNIKLMMEKFGVVYTSMSGSGSTVFGFFKGKSLKEAKKYFSEKGYFTYVSKNLP